MERWSTVYSCLLGYGNTVENVNCNLLLDEQKEVGQSKRLRPLGEIVLSLCIHFVSTFKRVILPEFVPGGSLMNSRTEIIRSCTPLWSCLEKWIPTPSVWFDFLMRGPLKHTLKDNNGEKWKGIFETESHDYQDWYQHWTYKWHD